VKLTLPFTTPLHLMPASRRRNLAALSFAAIAVTIAACSSSGTASSPNQLLPKVDKGRASTPPPFTFTFQPVDYTPGGSTTRVTAIDERANMIVGLNGNSPSTYSSWTAHTPLPLSTAYRDFELKNYPGAAGTYMASMSDGYHQAGTVFSPPPSGGLQCGACGIVHYNKGSGVGYTSGICGSGPCEWTFLEDPNEGTGNCAVTQVLGISSQNLVVGYYQNGGSSCGSQAFEGYFNSSGEYFADFDVPGADPNTTQATAVNQEGDVVGTAQFSGQPQGWYYRETAYCTLSAPNSIATYPLGINWEDQIVGYYEDGNQHSHGFLLLNPAATPPEQIWETVDDPLADHYTVINHIDTHHYITGWYKDTYGNEHGFVGTCTSQKCTTGGSQSRESGSRQHGDGKSSRCISNSVMKWKRR
jgi:hypothetical protein